MAKGPEKRLGTRDGEELVGGKGKARSDSGNKTSSHCYLLSIQIPMGEILGNEKGK